jgi:hypothetical protein
MDLSKTHYLDTPSTLGSKGKLPGVIKGDSEEQPLEERKFRIREIGSSEILERMYEAIPLRPGYAEAKEIAKRESLKPFSFILGDKDRKTTVVLPPNLESYADNWVMLTAVACIKMLDAEILPGDPITDPKEEIKYLSQWEPYLQGLASAIKSGRSIPFQNLTGKFREGYNWVVSQTEPIQKHPEFFRLSWKTPFFPLLGRDVWVKDAPSWARNWFNLVLQTARRCKPESLSPFAKSSIELKRTLTRHDFNYKKGAVFTEDERSVMARNLQKYQSDYDTAVAKLANLTDEVILHWGEIYAQKMKPLLDIDNQLSAICSERAQIIYASKNKRRLGTGAYLLGDRLSVLDPGDLLVATNPTGLIGDQRRSIKPKSRPDDISGIRVEFEDWADRVYPFLDTHTNPLIKSWMRNMSIALEVQEDKQNRWKLRESSPDDSKEDA